MGYFLDDLLASVTLGWWRRRRATRDRRSNRVTCSLRVASGVQDGLTDKWRAGRATISPGRLQFQPRHRPQDTVGPITVVALPRHTRRRPRTGEAIAHQLDPNSWLMTLKTPSAELEWAVRGAQWGWAMGTLTPPDE